MNDARSQMGFLEERLRSRMGNRTRNLRLDLREGGIVLRGQARTYYAKQLAQEAVMEAQSLLLVANEIQVEGEVLATSIS